jgi:FAD-dependent monooxygenase
MDLQNSSQLESGVETKGHELRLKNLIAETEEGRIARNALRDVILPGHWMHEQTGTVMGYRYNGSPIIITDPSTAEPPTSITEYIPSTWPGARAPHVFLADGKTSIFDVYGPDFSIIDFTTTGELSKEFAAAAKCLNIPITVVHIPQETHCRAIWERDVVLVRPDGLVAWRCPPGGAGWSNEDEIKKHPFDCDREIADITPNVCRDTRLYGLHVYIPSVTFSVRAYHIKPS